jgi:chain length determinant protein EpsF
VATATVLVDWRDEQTLSPIRITAAERTTYMQTQVDLIKSNRVATQVARELKLAQQPELREAWEKDTGGAGSIDEWVGAMLLEKLEVETTISNLLLVSFASDDARRSAAVANGFVKTYLEMVLQLRTEPTREAAAWFDEQLKTLRAQMSQSQAKLNAYQKAKGILVEDARVDVESARLTELSTQLLAARNASYEAIARHKNATELLESGAALDALPDVLANAHLNALKLDLGRVEARLEQEGAVLGPKHPQYLRTTAEVQGLRDKVRAEAKKLVAGLGNAVQQTRKREQELQAAIEAQNQRLYNIKDFRVEMAAMTRDIEAAQRSYDAVLTRYLTSKVDATAKQTNVLMLAPASEPLKPAHPKVGLIAALSVVLGTLLAAGIVYVLETLDRRVRSRSDLEARLAVPSLGRLSKWQPIGGRLLPAPIKAHRALPNPS